jgi:hypothetical protein
MDMSRPTPETDAELHGINAVCKEDCKLDAMTSHVRKLEQECDEAREKVEQQRKEIVRLNGATSHAGGTPLKIALRERDEAREALREIWQSGDAYLPYIEQETTNRWRKAAGWEEKGVWSDEILDFCRKLEQERDEARELHKNSLREREAAELESDATLERANQAERERDDLQKAVNGLCDHLGVSPVNTTLLAVEVLKIQRERDDARDALINIEEIFCDGEDTHDDWMKMGNIAKDYFKGLE